jgi:hypothetical protein
MTRVILMEEFHVTVYAPRGLREAIYDAMHRTLNGARFRAGLRGAVRKVLRKFPALHQAQVKVSR